MMCDEYVVFFTYESPQTIHDSHIFFDDFTTANKWIAEHKDFWNINIYKWMKDI